MSEMNKTSDIIDIEEWKKRGFEIVDPTKQDEWIKFVDEKSNELKIGMESAIELLKTLNNTENTVQVDDYINSKNLSTFAKSIVENVVEKFKFSKDITEDENIDKVEDNDDFEEINYTDDSSEANNTNIVEEIFKEKLKQANNTEVSEFASSYINNIDGVKDVFETDSLDKIPTSEDDATGIDNSEAGKHAQTNELNEFQYLDDIASVENSVVENHIDEPSDIEKPEEISEIENDDVSTSAIIQDINTEQNKVTAWIEKGKSILFPERFELWEQYVKSRADASYNGEDINCTLDLIKKLDGGAPLSKVNEILKNKTFPEDVQSMIKRAIFEFSRRGPEFWVYTTMGVLSSDDKKVVELKKQENKELEQKYGEVVYSQSYLDQDEEISHIVPVSEEITFSITPKENGENIERSESRRVRSSNQENALTVIDEDSISYKIKRFFKKLFQ